MTETGLVTSALTALAALAVVIAALLLTGRAARRAGLGTRAGKRLALEEALPLDARRRLLLLRCDGRALLVLTGGPQDVALGWVPDDHPPGKRPE